MCHCQLFRSMLDSMLSLWQNKYVLTIVSSIWPVTKWIVHMSLQVVLQVLFLFVYHTFTLDIIRELTSSTVFSQFLYSTAWELTFMKYILVLLLLCSNHGQNNYGLLSISWNAFQLVLFFSPHPSIKVNRRMWILIQLIKYH